MKTRSILGLGLVSSLICGTVATADMLGLDYRIAGTNALVEDVTEDNWTVEIYAVLPDGERLDAVAGNSENNKTVTTSGTFYQNAMGGPTSTSINSAFFPLAPDLEFDSYVTVGALHSDGYPFDNNALLDIGIDWAPFEAGGDVSTDNGTWFVTPADPQGQATLFTNQNCEDHYGVLIARLTIIGVGAFDETVYLNGLFQGKDALDNTWQFIADITVGYPTITDCNSNGVDDACDILNGTSYDDNGNGIPDECEFADCNDNGVADEDDIANGTSEDCNENGTPDECDLVDGDCNENGILDDCETFDDCNGNDIPDECETFNDCNSNGIPDECEALTDWDGNGIADICEGLVAYNATTGVGYVDLADANMEANDGDVIWVQSDHANAIASISHYDGVDNDCNGTVDNPGLEISLYDGSRFNVDGDAIIGSVRSGTSGTGSVNANGSVSVDFAMAYRNASLDFSGTTVNVGDAILRSDSEIGIDGDAHATGTWTASAGSIVFCPLTIDGNLRGTTDIMGNTTVNGEMRATADILIGANLDNNGLVAMHRGVLYVFGDLTNNGTILGEVDGGPGVRGGEGGPVAGDGMRVEGNYNVGENASIFLPHENWRLAVGGNFNVSIDDNTRFDMSQATLAIVESNAKIQQIEVISTDMGAIEDGLNPSTAGAFPLGTLRIESGSRLVELVDFNDNDGDEQEMSEVMYVGTLIVDSGATLNTNGYIIYTSNVDNQGIIIGEDDIIIIDPPVPGDLNGDSVVNIDDLLVVLGANWGPCSGCAGDANGDGVINIDDMLMVISNWTL
jgi:hypothetical protein